ncbi:MAG TPA: peptidase C39 family protein [Anaerolineales bacterium]|nr:peptidase C39 family protein [Anaerolineales bacterium]
MHEETTVNNASSTSEKRSSETAYRTGLLRWRAAESGFEDWTLNGARLNASGALELDRGAAKAESDPYPAGSYHGGNYYNGGAFFVGEATSPEMRTALDYREVIPSWNAVTPAGSWLEIQFRARYDARWSKWYVLGIWASGDSAIRRHSVKDQGDLDGFVAVDTFISINREESTDSFQLKLRLFSADGTAIPVVSGVSVAYSTSKPQPGQVSRGDPKRWNTLLEVLQCSQMVYPNGGNVWCSPTSLSMVLSYWDGYTGPREPRVRSFVDGVYDWVYEGHGNWPFNTAFAAALGYEGYIVRLTSLERVEEWVAAGVPVITSIAWGKGELTGADVEGSDGHLMVVVGFDSAGNPIVNDSAAPADESVRRVYLRNEFEPLWLRASGGAAYLIYPSGTSVPPLP